MNKAFEILDELIDDLRSREEEARKLLNDVPVDADESNVRQHVRLRAKASSYGHAAQLAMGARERLKSLEDAS